MATTKSNTPRTPRARAAAKKTVPVPKHDHTDLAKKIDVLEARLINLENALLAYKGVVDAALQVLNDKCNKPQSVDLSGIYQKLNRLQARVEKINPRRRG